MASQEGDDYKKVWLEFGQVLKEGAIEDHANKDKLAKLLRFSTTRSEDEVQDQSLDDYIARAAPEQDKIYYIQAETRATALASPHLERFAKQDLEVLLLSDRVDPWLVDSLTEYDGKALVDVAGADVEMPGGDGKITKEVDNDEHKAFLKKIKKALRERIEDVNVSQRLIDSPACVVAAADDMSPQIRRMLEASGQELPETKPVLEINVEHPLLTRLSSEADGKRFAALSEIVLDHALLADGSQLDNPADYVQRVNKLLLELDSSAATS
jgi:molecular chaperone HtpG